MLGELVEEGVFAVVGGPDGEVETPGDAALGGFPEEFGVGMFGEFVKADIAAINGHGLRIGGEGDDARAIIEFDDADFDLLDNSGGATLVIELVDRHFFFAVGEDGTGEVKDFGKFVALADVFEGAGIIFGGEEVIAIFEPEAFADVFEGVSVGPADTDGFFGESHGLLALIVDGLFSLDPGDLVRHEVFGEFGVGVY